MASVAATEGPRWNFIVKSRRCESTIRRKLWHSAACGASASGGALVRPHRGRLSPDFRRTHGIAPSVATRPPAEASRVAMGDGHQMAPASSISGEPSATDTIAARFRRSLAASSRRHDERKFSIDEPIKRKCANITATLGMKARHAR